MTNLTKRRKRSWIISMLILLLSTVGSAHVYGQNVIWSSGYPSVNASPVTIYDTSYVEVKFQVDAAVSGTRITITPPTGVTRVAKRLEALPGNNVTLPTTTTATYTLGNLTTSSVVAFRVPITTTSCAIADGLVLTIKLDKGSNATVFETFELPLVFQKPALNVGIPTSLQEYTNQGETKTYAVNLNTSTGVLNNWKLTFTFPSGYQSRNTVKLKNFKLNGYEIPANKVTKARVGSPYADSVYTVIFDNTFVPQALAAYGGKLTTTPVTFTVDAESLTPCGTKTVSVNGWFPSTANAATATPNVAPTSACADIGAVQQFIMQMPELGGQPIFQAAGSIGRVDKDRKSITVPEVCYSDGSGDPSYYFAPAYRNSGSVDGYITDQIVSIDYGTGYNLGTAFIDTSKITYKIGKHGTEKKIDSETMVITRKLGGSTIYRDVLPALVEKPTYITFPVPEKVVPGDTIFFYAGIHEGPYYEPSTGTERQVSYYLAYAQGSIPFSVDACGNAGARQGSSPSAYYTGPAIVGTPPVLSIVKGQKKTAMIEGMYTGNAMDPTHAATGTNANRRVYSVDVFVKMPDWLVLDPAELTANTAIQWVTSDDDNDAWPLAASAPTITNHGNNTYSIHLVSSDNTANKFNAGILKVQCQSADTCTVAKTDSITYWINFNPYEEGTAPTSCRFSFEHLGQAYQTVNAVCERKGFALDEFYLNRTTKGYEDLNNDNDPDNANPASNAVINNYRYLSTQDTGFVAWKGSVIGTPDITYKYLYATLTTGASLTLTTTGSNNYMVPFSDKAFIKINGVEQPNANLRYVRFGNNQCYMVYEGEVKGSDEVEIQLPFYFRAGWTSAPPSPPVITGECFISNSESTDPFNDPQDKQGDDILTTPRVYVRSVTAGMGTGTASPIVNNARRTLPQSAYYNYYLYPGGPKNFPNEARMYRSMDNLLITLTDGFEFTDDSVRIVRRVYDPNGTTYTDDTKWVKASYFTTDTIRLDLSSVFDYTYPNTTPLEDGKWMNPVENTTFFPYPYFRATKGAPTTGGYARLELFYTMLRTGVSTSVANNLPLPYNSTATTLTASTTSVTATTSDFTIPVLSVGNPNNIGINNVWLYVEGNVKDISITSSGTTITGAGYEGRWLKVADNIPSGGNALQFALNATYVGGGGCTDQVKIYTVTAYDGTWDPSVDPSDDAPAGQTGAAINYELNKTDIEHSGASRTITVTIPATAIGGSLAVANADPLIGTNVIAFEKNQQLTAKINTHGAAGALRNGVMTITVPAGQQYVAGSAKIAYPSDHATPSGVDAAYEAYLVSQIGGTAATDRTFDFDFGAAVGDPSAMIAGTGTSADQEAALTLLFTPGCDTKLTGIRYEGVLGGESACGQTATGTGKKVYSAGQYPNLTTAYAFDVTNTFNGNSVVGPEDKVLNVDMTVMKSYGPLETIPATDSVEVKMHKAFDITAANYAGSSVTDAFQMGSNTISGDIRSVRMSLPVNYINGLPNKGVNAVIGYTLALSYDPANYTVLDGDEQTLSASVISNQVFDASCAPQYATIGNKDTLMSIVMFDPYPAVVCPVDTATVTISNSVVNSDYSYDWFRDNTKADNIGSGDVLDFLSSALASDAIYVEVIRNADSKSLGLVQYPYTTYDAVTADFEVEEVCFGTETTFTDKTKVGTANASNSNISSWKWYADGETTPFATTQNADRNFTTEGNHTVKLIVESTNGCIDSVEQTVYVKPRAVVNFTPSQIAVCAGEEIIFTNNSTVSEGTATYEYKYGDGVVDATGVHAYANDNGSPYTVTLVATTDRGCIDSTKTTITVSPEPIISTTGVTVCQNTQVNLANYVTNPGGYALTYYTELTGGTQVTNLVTPSSDVTYYVEARNIVTNCISITRQPVAITVNPLPVVTASNTSVCVGTGVDLSTLVDNPSAYALTYYDVPTGGTNTSSNINVTTTGNKLYYVEAQNSLTGCVSASRAVITVTGKAIPTIGVNAPSQTKYNGEMSDVITFTGNGTAYSWTNSNSSIGIPASGTSNPIQSYQLLNTTGSDVSATITAKSTLDGCESAEVTHVINIKAKIVYTVSPLAQTVCNGAPTTQVAFSSTATGVTYEWTCDTNIGAGTSGTGNIASFAAVNTTTSPVTATFTVTPNINSVVVGDPVNFTITVNPTPIITTQTIATCENVSIDLKTAITGLTNATLSEVQFSTSNTAFDLNIIVNPAAYLPTAASTTLYARATNTASSCPSAIVGFTVTRNPLPGFTVTNQTICSGGTLDLTTAVSGLTNAVIGNVQFSTTGGASFDAGVISNPAGYSTLSSATIYARATNSNGCVSTISSFLVNVNPLPTFNTQSIAVCSGKTINLQTAVLNLQNAAVSELEFNTASDFGAGTAIANPAAYAASVTGTIYVRATNATTTCVSSAGSFTLTVNPTPVVTLKTIATCEGTTIDLKTAITNITNATVANVEFSTADGSSFDANIIVNPAAYLPTAASVTLYARATNATSNCPSDVVSFTVTRNALPTFTTANRTICSGGTMDLTTAIENLLNATIAQVQFSTTSGNSFDVGLIANPAAYSSLTGVTIYARATNSNGCVSVINSFQILTDALPSFNTQGIAVCSGNTINLETAILNLQNATLSELQFNTASDFGAGTAISTPTTYAPAATQTIYVKAANAGTNCASAAGSFTLTVNPTPVVTLKTIATCEGTTIDLKTAVTNVTNATVANVEFSTADGSGFDANVIVNPAAYIPTTASTTLYARATNASTSCPSAIVNFTVTRNALPTFTTANRTICSGGTVDLTTAIENLLNATIAQVQFSTTSGNSFDVGLIANPAAYSSLTGVTIYARATNSNGCVSVINSFQILTDALPSFSTQGIAVCSGNTINLETAILNLQNATLSELQFNTASDFGAGTAISTPTTYAPAATQTIYVKAANAGTNCASAAGSFTLTVNPTPVVTLKTIATCEGTTIDLKTAVTNVTNATVANVEFSTADGSGFDANIIVNPAAYMPTTASTTLYARATNASTSCPSAIVSFVVTRNPLPTFTTVNKTICSGGTVDLTTAIENLSDATIAQVQFSTTSGNSFDAGLIATPASYSTSTNTTIYVRATNSNGCVSSIISFQVNVNPLPTFNTQGIAICSGNTVNLQTAVLNLQYASVSELEFNTASDFAAGTMISNPTAYAPAATTTVYVRATNATTTCVSAVSSFILTVNPTPTVTLQTIATCEGTTIDLKTAITNVTNATVSNVEFSTADGIGFDANVIVNPAAYLPTVASTTLYARATNTNTGCQSAVVSFIVTRNPLPTFTTVDKTICSGGSVNLTTAITGLNDATIAQVQFSTTSGTSFDAGLIANPASFSTLNSVTIYARATNSNTCVSAIGSFLVNVNPLPTFTTQNIAVCSGKTVDIQTAVLNLQYASVNELQFNTAADFAAGTMIANPAAYAPSATATIYVRATNATTTCVSIIGSFTLTVNPTPTVTLQTIATCEGTTIDLKTAVTALTNASINDVQFSVNPAASFDAGMIVNPAAYLPTAASTTLYARATNVTSSCASDVVSFTVTRNPLPTFTTVNKTICYGDAVDLTTAITGLNDATIAQVQFSTTSGTNFDAGLIANPANYNSLNSATIYARATNSNGCVSLTASFLLTVNPLPTFDTQNLATCAGTAVNLQNAISNLQYATIGELQFNTAADFAAGTAISNPAAYTPVASGIIYVKAINAATTCEGNAESFMLTVKPVPTVQAIANQTLCNGETGEIFIDGTGNSYTATSSDVSVVVTSFQTNDAKHLKLVAANNTTAPVTVTITVTPVAEDCPGTAITFDVTVNPTPVVNVVADQVKCSGTSTDAITFSGNVTGGTYRWESVYKNIGLTSGVGNFPAQAVTNTTNATLQDEIIVTPMYGTCEGTPVRFYIQVNPVPTVYTVQDEVYCAGETANAIQLAGNTTGATYTWTFSNPAIKLGLSTATSAVIDPFLTLTAGTSDINVVPTYTNYGLTCTGASVKVATITVNPKPTVDFSTTVTGLGTVSFTNNSTGATSYTWNFGDGSAEVNTTSNAAQVYTYTTAGTYMVTLTATNGNCSSTISKQIAVSVTTDLEARFNIASLSTQCLSGNSFVFNNTSQVTTAGHTISTYEWDFGDATTATVANPPAKTYAQAGNYTVTLKVTEAPGGETSIVTKTVTVTGLPVITDGVAPAAVCDGERLQVNMPTVVWNNNSPMNGQWLLNGTLFDPTVTNVVASDNGKLLQYQLTTACGTVTSTGTAITVNAIPVTPSYMDHIYCNGTSVPAISLGSVAGITYQWTQSGDNIGLSTLSGTGSIPAFTAVNNGSNTLTAVFYVTAFNGTCQGNTVQFSIKVAPEAKVSSDLTVPAICSGSTFMYDIQSLTPGASFVWTRLADADINGGATNTGTTSHIEEVLTNTGANVVTVQYEIKTTSNICTGVHTDILTVDVKPTPAIALDTKLIEVCPGEVIAKLPYTTNQPAMNMTYSIDFGLEAIYQGVVDVVDQPLTADTILITLPATLAPGYYNGTISLQAVGGCAGTKDYPFVIQLLESLKITEQPQAANLCNNDGLELSVTATGKNLTYQWFKDGEAINGATSPVYDLSETDESHYGDYYVVISSACQVVMSDIVRIEGNNLMLLTKWDDVIFVSNADRTFTAYQWYKDGKPVANNGTYQYYTQEGGLDGNYQVQVTYADGGVEMSCPYKVVKTGITTNPTIHIYPNPVQTSKQVTIDMNEFSSEEYMDATVDLFDLSGKNIAQVIMDQPVQTMTLNVPAGTYVIRITTTTGKVRSEKIIVTD